MPTSRAEITSSGSLAGGDVAACFMLLAGSKEENAR